MTAHTSRVPRMEDKTPIAPPTSSTGCDGCADGDSSTTATTSADAPSILNQNQNYTIRYCQYCYKHRPDAKLVLLCDYCALFDDTPGGGYHTECLEELIIDQVFRLSGHVHCKECMTEIEPEMLEEVLSVDALQLYKALKAEALVPYKWRTYCHKTGCEAWIPQVFGLFGVGDPVSYDIFCLSCGKRTCAKCKRSSHRKVTSYCQGPMELVVEQQKHLHDKKTWKVCPACPELVKYSGYGVAT